MTPTEAAQHIPAYAIDATTNTDTDTGVAWLSAEPPRRPEENTTLRTRSRESFADNVVIAPRLVI